MNNELKLRRLEARANLVEGINLETSIAFVKLAENNLIDEITATEHSNLFIDWSPNVDYKVNEIRREDENLYKCLQAHTSQEDWLPSKTPSLWKKIGNPADEYPEWSQPISNEDAYMLGDKVSFEGKHYVSSIDNNVWKPTVYGWNEEN
ncbi:MAG: hypothetical protein KBT03_03285 [Bacteroidales bacterium]|nr:hypothetical protein [Candidatus Scybalousia scybalohippi]